MGFDSVVKDGDYSFFINGYQLKSYIVYKYLYLCRLFLRWVSLSE